jgi:hypothetical protein
MPAGYEGLAHKSAAGELAMGAYATIGTAHADFGTKSRRRPASAASFDLDMANDRPPRSRGSSDNDSVKSGQG